MRTDATAAIQQDVDAGRPVNLNKYNHCEIGSVDVSGRPVVRLEWSQPGVVYARPGFSDSQGMFHLKQTQDTAERMDSFLAVGSGRFEVNMQGSGRQFFNQSVYGTETRPDVPGLRIQLTRNLRFREGGGGSLMIRAMKVTQSVVEHCQLERSGGGLQALTDTENESRQELITRDCVFDDVAFLGASSQRPSMLSAGTVKKIPPRILYENCEAYNVSGRWKTHAHNAVTIRNCDISAAAGNQDPGFDLPPNLIGAGVNISRSTFRKFKYAVRSEGGEQFYGNQLNLHDITAIDCKYLCSQSHRVCVHASGAMVAVNGKAFSDPASVSGDWDPVEVDAGGVRLWD